MIFNEPPRRKAAGHRVSIAIFNRDKARGIKPRCE
jgi:hypothetical protein